MAVRTLYLVRHGEYDWNTDPNPAKGLTTIGIKQAALTAKRLAAVPATAIYCSDIARAIETAAAIARAQKGASYSRKRSLRECWLAGFPSSKRVPREVINAESVRVDAVFQRFIRPARGCDKHEIIVAHGNLIRYLVVRVLTGTKLPYWTRMRTMNCAVSEIAIDSKGQTTLVSYNDVGHLPADLVTTGMPAARK